MVSTLPATASTILTGSGKILCLADIRGDFRKLNQYVEETGAVAVVHTGDFGFMDGGSPARMAPRILRHVLSYTPLLDTSTRPNFLSQSHGPSLFSLLQPTPSPSSFVLSQLGLLLTGEIKLSVPVFTVYGPVEDVSVLEKFRTGEYEVENLRVLDEAVTRLLEVGGLKLRLLGLGGAVMMHKMFDNGDATGTIAGGNGTVWATALQIGELVDTAQRVFDPSETRLLVTHGPIGRDGLLAQLALVLKADLTVSGGLHFRFTASFNEFAVNADAESFRSKLLKSKAAFMDVYESARPQLDKMLLDDQKDFLAKALEVANKVPAFDGTSEEDQLWKNCWNWNLSEAEYGRLVLRFKEGRVSAETMSTGLNFNYRQYRKPSSQPIARPSASHVTTATGPTQTPPPGVLGGGFHHNQQQQQQQQQLRNTIAPVAPRAMNQSHQSQTSGVSQIKAPAHNSAVAAPLSSAAKAAESSAPHAQPSQSLPSKPSPAPASQSQLRKPEIASAVASGSSKPEVKAKAPASVPATTTPGASSSVGPTDGETNSEANPAAGQQSSLGKKNKLRTTAKERAQERAQSNNVPIGKNRENGFKQQATSPTAPLKDSKDSKEKETANSKAEPVETAAPEPKTESTEKGEIVTKLPEEGAAAAASTDVNGSAPPTRQPMNPHTLYVKKLPRGITEEELKEFWPEDIRKTITKIKIPTDFEGKPRSFAYVEFTNDEEMQAALTGHGPDIKGTVPNVSVSNPPSREGGVRGGRGGFTGGFRGGPRGSGEGGRGGSRGRGAPRDWSTAPATNRVASKSGVGAGGGESAAA